MIFLSALKSEGFYNFENLAKLAHQFLTQLGSKMEEPKDEEVLSIRDIRLVVKLACLIRE